MKLQGLDPESGLWILCKKLEEKNGRINVKWSGYANSTAWLNECDIRDPIIKRPLRSQPSRIDWPICKHPSFAQRFDKISIKRDDGSRSAEMIVYINDPFQCNMTTTCKQTLRYELLVEGQSMSAEPRDTPKINEASGPLSSSHSQEDQSLPNANPRGVSREQEKTPNAKNNQVQGDKQSAANTDVPQTHGNNRSKKPKRPAQIPSENQPTRKQPAQDKRANGQKKRPQTKQATQAPKFLNRGEGRRSEVAASNEVQVVVIESENMGRYPLLPPGASQIRSGYTPLPKTPTGQQRTPLREVFDNAANIRSMPAQPRTFTSPLQTEQTNPMQQTTTPVRPLPVEPIAETPRPLSTRPQPVESVPITPYILPSQGTSTPTQSETTGGLHPNPQLMTLCEELAALKQETVQIKKRLDEICVRQSFLERKLLEQQPSCTPGLAEAIGNSLQILSGQAEETCRDRSSTALTEEYKRKLSGCEDPKEVGRQLAKIYFTEEERASSNCNGIRKQALDPMRLAQLRSDLFSIVQTPAAKEAFVWKTVTTALDAEMRSKAAYRRKKSL